MTRQASRAAAAQAALVAVLVGVMMILLGGGGAARRPEPTATRVRPATAAERRQAEADRLSAVLDEIARRRLLTAPPVYRGL